VSGALLLLLGATALAPLPQTGSETRAFVELSASRERAFVEEPLELRLRFGIEARFLQEHVLQPFQRRLDVPVQVEAGCLDELPGAVARAGEEEAPGAEDAAARRTFVLNDGVAVARRLDDLVRDGRTFAAFELRRSFRPVVAGTITIAAPRLRLAHATRFDEDLIRGRVAADRRDAQVEGAPIVIAIEPLPEAGRPARFTGAVGRFTVRADASTRELTAGEPLTLTLTIEGEGNCERFEAPPLDELEGFHVLGRLEERGSRRRRIVCEIAPLSAEVKRVPPLSFTFFDPSPPAGYRMLRTEEITLAVRPDGAARPIAPPSDPVADAPGGSGLAQEIAAAAVAVAAVAALLAWRRARRRATARLADPAAGDAADALDHCRRATGAELAPALADYLAARLRCPPAAVIAPDLAARLAAAGVPPPLAARAAAALTELTGARYRTRTPDGARPAGAASIGALVAELEDAFSAAARAAPRRPAGGG